MSNFTLSTRESSEWGGGPHEGVRPDVMCVERGCDMIWLVWSFGIVLFIPKVAHHLPYTC